MKIIFRIERALLESMRADLARLHPFAAERVGFLACKIAALRTNKLVVIGAKYLPLKDEEYENDRSMGAVFGSGAILRAMQLAYDGRFSIFHIHAHEHVGQPWFSRIDLAESKKYVPNFWNVQRHLPHGTLVTSEDCMAGLCWLPQDKKARRIARFETVGRQLSI